MDAGFTMLCAGGVDYCYGLSKFGFSQKQFMETTLDMQRASAFIYKEESPRQFCVNLNNILQYLKGLNRTRIRTDCIEEFTKELTDIVFCMIYFLGFDPTAQRGGPVFLEPISFAPNINTVTALFDTSDPQYRPYTYIEQCPALNN